MRNALDIGDGIVVTTDNSGGIGGKMHDVVAVPDQVTAHFATRVALLEQWAADAEPVAVLIHNLSGTNSWDPYVQGVEEAFQEAGCAIPSISGSTETNMELLQSALAVTIIGKRRLKKECDNLAWYVYGKPLVGNEVLEHKDEIASLRLIKKAIDNGLIQRIWPVGSGGIQSEFRKMTGIPEIEIQENLDIHASAGPATSVLIGIHTDQTEQAQKYFNGTLYKITIH